MKQHLKLILLIICTLIMWKVNGQTIISKPSIYTTIANGNQQLINVSLTDTINWFMWPNDSMQMEIRIKKTTSNGKNNVKLARLYVEKVGGFIQLVDTSYINSDDSLIIFYQRFLNPNGKLYLNIITETFCGTCGATLPTVNINFESKTTSCGTITQPNCELVKDGGMESFTTCSAVKVIGPFSSLPACFWQLPNVIYTPTLNPWAGTADYFNTCGLLAIPGTPGASNSANATSNVHSRCLSGLAPHSGSGYLGAYLYGPSYAYSIPNTRKDYREYIVNQLASPMIAGKTYSISMYVRLSNDSKYAVSNISMLLTNSVPVQSVPAPNLPSIIQPSSGQFISTFNGNAIVSDKNNWTLLSIIYTPVANCNYITIGNFNNSSTTTKIDLDITNSWTYCGLNGRYPGANCTDYDDVAYYYFDNVSIKSLELNAGPDKSICTGSTTVLTSSINCLPTGANVTYTWSPSATLTTPNSFSTSASPTVTTTYTLTATLSFTNGASPITLTDYVTVTVTNAGSFTLTANANPNPICLSPGSTTTLSTNGGANLSYTWTTGTNTYTVPSPVVSPTVTTTYTVTTVNCGQTYSAVVTVTVNTVPAFTVVPNPVCEGSAVTVISSSLTTINSINFNDPLSADNISNPHYYNTGGNYSITINSIYNAGNCLTNTVIPIVVSVPQTLGLTYTTAPCSNTYTFSANLGCVSNSYNYIFGIKGSGGIVYAPPITTVNICPYTFTASGTYTVEVISSFDNYNSVATLTINVQPITYPIINISAAPSPTICLGNSSILTASGASTYTWSTGATTSLISVTPSVNTMYTVTATNTSGCSSTKTISITVVPNLTLTATANPTVICAGSSSTLTATGATSYTWMPGALLGASVVVTPTANTIYTVTGSNGACTNTKTLTVLVNPKPTILISSTPSVICSGQSTTLTASGATTYTWNPTGVNGNTLAVSPSVTTTYTATGTSSLGCINTKTVTVNVTATPTINITGTPTIVCTGSSSTLSASGATSYTWNTGATTTSIVVTPTVSSTIYTVTGKTGSCSSIKTITITSINLPTVTAIASSSAICVGLSTTLTAGGATSYTWNPGNTTSNTAIVSPTATTIYTVTGTNANCSNTKTISVTVNPVPSLTLSPLTIGICLGQSITISASGASTYSWNTGVTTASISLSPTVTTNYTVTGTGSNGCKSQAVYNLNIKPLPVISVSASSNPICAGNTTTLTMSAGGTLNSWSNGVSSNTNVVSPGITTTYTAYTTKFSTGCSNSAIITVTVNPFTLLTVNPSTICVGQTATLTANGATSYTWNTGANTSSITVSPTVTTNYTVSGSSSSCPTGSTSLVLTVNSNPTITATANPTTMCIGNSATLTATGATTYSWSSGGTSAITTVTPGAINVYTVTGTSGACSVTNTVAIALTAQYCCQSAISTIGTSTTSSINYSNNSNGGGAVIDMQGTITFTANSTMSNYIIRMAPQTSLVINPGITVTFSNSTLYSCTELWDGITLLTNLTTSVSSNVTIVNSTVEDMYNGINLDYGGISAVSGGSITVSGSKLNKNYVSVYMYYAQGYGVPNSSYPLSITGSTISSVYSSTSPQSTLKQSSFYSYAYPTSANTPYTNFPRSYCGVFAGSLNKNLVVIGDSTGTAGNNRFDNLDFALLASDVNIYVHNNHFTNITGSTKNISSITSAPNEIGMAVISSNSYNRFYVLRVGSNNALSTNGNPYPKGNVFEDCYRGVVSSRNLRLWVKGNEFKSNSTSWPALFPTGNLYDYNIAQYAISQYDLGEMSNMSYNYITNQNYGIYNSFSIDNFLINQAKIKIENNFIDAPSSSGFCKQAIQIEQPVGTNNLLSGMLTVKNNTIQNVYGGIKALNVNGGALQINDNPLISLSANKLEGIFGSFAYMNNYPRTAILLQSCTDAVIANNSNITSVGTINPSFGYYTAVKGIWLDGSGGTNAKVNCNVISNMGRCMQFSGTSLNKVSKNVMNGSGDYQGLVLSNNGRIGQQGSTSITNDNEWNGFTGGAAKYAETYVESTSNVNVLASGSVQFVKPGSPYQPTQNYADVSGNEYVTGVGNGIRVQSSGTTGETCLVLKMMGGDNQNTDNGSNAMRMASDEDTTNVEVFEALASDTAFYEVYQNETQYRNQQLVYELINNQSIDTTKTLSDFYTANQTTNYQTIVTINNAFANEDYQTAQNINSSLTANNMIEAYQKRVNELLIKYISNQSQKVDSIPNPLKITVKAPVFDALELADLSTIANSCFDKYGSVITQARVLMNNVTNTIIEFNDNCKPEFNQRKKQINNSTASTVNVKLYPNPSKGLMELEYDLGNHLSAKMNLYDITGKLISSYKLDSNKGILQMNEQNLNNGVYFYHILVGEKTIKTDKIVIIK